MMKTSGSTESKIRLGERMVGVGDNNRARRSRSEIDESEINDVKVDGGKDEVDEVEKKVQKSSKSKNLSKSKKIVRSSDFLNPRAKLVFAKLR